MADRFLQKTWEVVDRTGDRYGIRSTANALETALLERESGLVIGSCKALIEGFCKSILDEKGVSYDAGSDIGPLARLAVGALGVAKGVENEKKAREAFMKLVSSIARNVETAAQTMGELRNDFCPIAHGRAAGHVQLDIHYAEFVARQSDSLIGFVFEMRMSREVLEPSDPPQNDAEFDSFIDDEFSSAEIYGDIYVPSEILINVSPEKYSEALAEYKEQLSEGGEV